GHCQHGRLFHHITQLTGNVQLAVAFGDAGLYEENIAPVGSPGQSGSNAGYLGTLGHFGEEFALAQIFLQLVDADRVRAFFAFGNFSGYAPANRSDLPLQRSYAGFTRILLNNSFNRLMSDFYLLIRKPVFFNLLGHQMSFSNLRLDRKSTRLNSSHVSISYAVFC